MRGPIGVRLRDATTDMTVTRYVTSLRFRKVAPGGHHSASCTVVLPRYLFPSLGPADRLYIYDTRTGQTLWEGYCENPTPVDGPEGQAWDISALGGMSLAQDMVSPIVFMDSDLSHWTNEDPLITPGGSLEVVDNKLHLSIAEGTPTNTNSRIEATYTRCAANGQAIAAITGSWSSGLTGGNPWQTQFLTFTLTGGWAGEANYISPTAGGVMNFNYFSLASGSGSYPATRDYITVRLLWSGGASSVANDTAWLEFTDLRVRARLKNADGTFPTTTWNSAYVTVWEAVHHVVGALLPGIDGLGAFINQTGLAAAQFTHLVYDAAAPATILDDLTLYNPNGLWEILETNSTGKHRFVYRDWPTTPRYVVSTKDGYTATGGDVDLCNRILVTQTDAEGKPVVTVVTSVVPELGTRVRDADPITIPIGASAATIGAAVLATKAGSQPRPGTVTIRRQVLDNLTGDYVRPWEVEPGYLVTIRETGETLRLTEVEYDDDSGTASLTLGNPVLTVEQRVAALGVTR